MNLEQLAFLIAMEARSEVRMRHARRWVIEFFQLDSVSESNLWFDSVQALADINAERLKLEELGGQRR